MYPCNRCVRWTQRPEECTFFGRLDMFYRMRFLILGCPFFIKDRDIFAREYR